MENIQAFLGGNNDRREEEDDGSPLSASRASVLLKKKMKSEQNRTQIMKIRSKIALNLLFPSKLRSALRDGSGEDDDELDALSERHDQLRSQNPDFFQDVTRDNQDDVPDVPRDTSSSHGSILSVLRRHDSPSRAVPVASARAVSASPSASSANSDENNYDSNQEDPPISDYSTVSSADDELNLLTYRYAANQVRILDHQTATLGAAQTATSVQRMSTLQSVPAQNFRFWGGRPDARPTQDLHPSQDRSGSSSSLTSSPTPDTTGPSSSPTSSSPSSLPRSPSSRERGTSFLQIRAPLFNQIFSNQIRKEFDQILSNATSFLERAPLFNQIFSNPNIATLQHEKKKREKAKLKARKQRDFAR